MSTSILKLRAAKHTLLYKRVPEQPALILNDCLQVSQKTIVKQNSTINRKTTPNTSTQCSDHAKDNDTEHKGSTGPTIHPHKQTQWRNLKQKRILKKSTINLTSQAEPISPNPSPRRDEYYSSYSQFSCPVINVKIKKKVIDSEADRQSLTPRPIIKSTVTLPSDEQKSLQISPVHVKRKDSHVKSPKSLSLSEKYAQTRRTSVKPKPKENHENEVLVVNITKRNKVEEESNSKSQTDDHVNFTSEPTISKVGPSLKSSIWKQDDSLDKNETDVLWEIPANRVKIQRTHKRELKRSKTSTGYYQDRTEPLPIRSTKSARPQRCPTAPPETDKPALTGSECRAKCLQLEEYLYNDNLPKFQETLLPYSPKKRKMLADFKETKSTANIFFRACGLTKVPFVKFLLEHCSPDLELQGPFFLLDDHTQYLVTPLWQAAASGSLHLVRILNESGADINASSDTGSSPLLVACYMARVDVATYLVSNKAVINSCNSKGLTCLMNAVHNVDLVRLLVLNGAEINRADNSGNTSLHYAVEEGRVKTVKILVEQGGNPLVVNKDGFNSIHSAAKYRHRDVLEYLIQASPLKVPEIVDLYEMFGAMIIMMDDDLDEGFVYLHKATTLRYLDKSKVITKTLSHSVLADNENENEFTGIQQLNKLSSNPNRLRIQSLMIFERQWGSSHDNFLQLLLYCGATFADHLNFREAANLWRLSYQLHFEKYIDKCNTYDPFNYNVLKSLGFIIKLLVQWRKVLVSKRQIEDSPDLMENNRTNSIDRRYFISEMNVRRMLSLVVQHCIAAHKWLNKQTPSVSIKYKEAFHLLLRSAICVLLVYVESFSVHERGDDDSVWQHLHHLISLNPRGERNETLLHMCTCSKTLNKLDLDISDTQIKWPSVTVVNIALILGANPTDSDNGGNTPLHFAAISQRQGVLSEDDRVIQSLLSKGAHADQVNNFGQTAYDLLRRQDLCGYNNMWQKAVSLKCLSARVITAYAIEYIGEIPTSLYSFIELHRSVHIT